MKWNLIPILLALSGLLFQISFAQQFTLSQQGTEEIDRFFSDAVQQRKTPAVEAIVVDKEKVLYHSVFGKRNTGKDIDLQKGDLFDVASMTKPVTAVAAMILIEQGKINLNEAISNYLPAFEELEVLTSFNEDDSTYTSQTPANPITVRHLLTHTSGMGYPWFYESLQLLYEKQGNSGFQYIYDYMELPLLYHPGSGWSYGISYQVLGSLVEKVSGKSLDKFFKSHIFSPLDMQNTFYDIPKEKLDRRVTLQIRKNDEWIEQPLPDHHEPLIIGDATLISTGRDYARLLQMLLNKGTLNGTRILNERSVTQMTQNQIGDLVVEELFNEFPSGAGRDKFGFGFKITMSDPDSSDIRPSGSYSWAGSNNTFFWVDPAHEIAAVLLMHYLPFHDETAQNLYKGFEQLVYEHIK